MTHLKTLDSQDQTYISTLVYSLSRIISRFKYTHPQTNNNGRAIFWKRIRWHGATLRGGDEFPLCLRILPGTMTRERPRKPTWTRSGRKENTKQRIVDEDDFLGSPEKTEWNIITNNCFFLLCLFLCLLSELLEVCPLTPHINKYVCGYTAPPDKNASVVCGR